MGRWVVFTYRTRRDAADRLMNDMASENGRVAHASLDLGSVDDIRRALGALDAVDTVIYAAGPDIPQRFFSNITVVEWHQFAMAELVGFFNLMHVALPMLRTRPRSHIVATTSCATDRVIPGDVLSAVPKAGIEMLVRQIAREEGRYGVRANCVAPGIIDAGLGLKAQQDYYTRDIWDAQRKSVPLRSFGTAEAIADAVAFLVGTDSDYITGQTIVVDGGLSL
jgi:NAD(P)-dependent dehydrogenase (short-subunit alcohol dehydrogenase family)